MADPNAGAPDLLPGYTLADLLKQLFKDGGIEEIKKFFERCATAGHHYKLTVYEVKNAFLIGVKYIDGRNGLWQGQWALQARGAFYVITTTPDGEVNVKLIKGAVMRAAELLSKYLVDSGVKETQDVKKTKKPTVFAGWQKQLMDDFRTDTEDIAVKGFISFKADGSLLVITVYKYGTFEYNIMLGLCQQKYNTLPSVQLAAVDYAVKNVGADLIMFASQGTLIFDEMMNNKFLNYIMSRNITLDMFFSEIYALSSLVGDHPVKSFSFELISSEKHGEIATQYANDDLVFIGVMYRDEQFDPHFTSAQTIFNEPFWAPVSSTGDVTMWLRRLEDVVYGRVAASELFGEKTIHPEGFILYTVDPDVPERLNASKIKTPVYYLIHKMLLEGLRVLLDLPEALDFYYPELKRLRVFYTDIDQKIAAFKAQVIEAIDAIMMSMQSPEVNADQKIRAVVDSPRKSKGSKRDFLIKNKQFGQPTVRELVSRYFGPFSDAVHTRRIDEFVKFALQVVNYDEFRIFAADPTTTDPHTHDAMFPQMLFNLFSYGKSAE